MARRGKSIYDQINECSSEIDALEQKLLGKKDDLSNLHKIREEQEMKELYELMKSKGFDIDKAKTIIGKA